MENKEYVKLLKDADIFSYSLAKGTFILPPNGYLLWEQAKSHLDSEFFKIGVRNVVLPTLIPLSLFQKEKEHVKGFSPELFHVSQGTIEKSDSSKVDGLVLRPTSEVLFYSWFAERLQSHKDLPFLYNQWGQVFRAEKNTKPFLRNSEFLWQEGHTIHASSEESLEFVSKIVSLYKNYFENVLSLSVITGIKSSLERFPGALESYTFECLLPDFQSLQLATVHYFADNFSKAFSVKFNNQQNLISFPLSTSWGTSTRAIGALVLSHNDQRGLVFPSKVAPFQVGIVINNRGLEQNKDFLKFKEDIISIISSSYRCKVYNKTSQFSSNLSKLEKEGCPLRIVLGKQELMSNSVSLHRRVILHEKFVVQKNDLLRVIQNSLLEIDRLLFNSSQHLLKENIFPVSDYQKLVEKMKVSKGLFLLPFCNSSICEEKTKKKIPSFSFRCLDISLEFLNETCTFCSRRTFAMAYFGRSY